MRRQVVAVAHGSGPVHVAVPEGRGWRGACFRKVAGRTVEVYEGRQVVRAWSLGPRCADCAALVKRGPSGLLQVTGW